MLDLLEEKVTAAPDKPLYSFLDRDLVVSTSLSYRDVHSRARRFARTLQYHHCAGKPVLLYCPHGPEFLIGFFACVLAGTWAVPVARHRARSQVGLAALCRVSGATTIISTSARASSLSRALAGTEIMMLSVDQDCVAAEDYRRPAITPTDIAFIQFTSGSTSSPRGVVISHANVMHNADQIRQAFATTADDVGVTWLPFHHDMGLIGHVIQPLFAGIHNYFLNPMDFLARPARWLQAISDFGGTISGGPDFAFALATDKVSEHELTGLTLAKWRLAYSGAEKIRPETLARFAHKFSATGFASDSWFPCYGLAESTLFVTGQFGVEACRPSGPQRCRSSVCVGKPVADTSVMIKHPGSEDNVVDGNAGEVCISSPSVAVGYFNDKVASKKTFRTLTDNGRHYVRTGDCGFMRDQRLYLLGRYKNVIKRRGCSYHAEDIEAALKIGLGEWGIQLCAAFAVDVDDTERLVLLLEQGRRLTSTEKKPHRQLTETAAALIVDQFGIAPDDIQIVAANTLPLTSSGKIQRHACVDFYQQRTKKADRLQKTEVSDDGLQA
ncbi:MAG: fatty acyl-AMP ligase [Pseudohongiella sp.]|uniref:fatty acyl-AMP ligase n=1 Tax=Pseudohongiella sp. TaxID=1979412 RepID=UPI0034A076AD